MPSRSKSRDGNIIGREDIIESTGVLIRKHRSTDKKAQEWCLKERKVFRDAVEESGGGLPPYTIEEIGVREHRQSTIKALACFILFELLGEHGYTNVAMEWAAALSPHDPSKFAQEEAPFPDQEPGGERGAPNIEEASKFAQEEAPSPDQELGGEEELQTSKKQAAPKKTARGRHAGAAAQQPRAPLRQLLRLAGRDPEHPIVIDDDVSGEHKARADQSAITPLRRSPRFHVEDKSLGKSLSPPNPRETSANRKTKTAHRKDKNQESLKRNRGSARFPPRKDISDVSNKKSDKQELKPNHCKVQTGKRKRGTERRVSSKKQSCQDPKPLPAYCQEIAPRNEPSKSTHRRIEKDPSIAVKLKVGDERLTNIDENINKPSGTEREGMGNFCGSDDWTKEQDMALRKAYFSARPSPHFWKKVSKMVPGRSAEDCFNRIYSDLSTPTPIGPRPRTNKTAYSPIGNFTLSDPELPNILEPMLGRRKTAKQKSLVAQKTVKHLLQKHCRIDQAQEADHFSIFESSPSALELNLSFEDSPGTPDSCMNSASLGKRSGSSSARKKSFSRLRTKPSEPSPAVLKPIKNVILHEKYIDQLARREGTKRPRRRTPAGSKAADSGKSLSEQQAGSVKTAKNALISEATDFISSFKMLQANPLAHVVENSEDEIECDASDCSHDDKELGGV